MEMKEDLTAKRKILLFDLPSRPEQKEKKPKPLETTDRDSKPKEEMENDKKETKSSEIQVVDHPDDSIQAQWLSQIKDNQWNEILEEEFKQPYFQELVKKLKQEWDQGFQVYPPKEQIFRAFELTCFSNLRAVIIGQDPYHGPGEAHGLAFSVPYGKKVPPSLNNIFKELKSDVPGFEIPDHGNLEGWARQGVLLLNSCLTVRKGTPESHSKMGWQKFTSNILKRINDNLDALVVIMWGKYAKTQGAVLSNPKYLKLQSGHPSPYSEKFFFGNNHFTKANEYLRKKGIAPIRWKLTDEPKQPESGS